MAHNNTHPHHPDLTRNTLHVYVRGYSRSTLWFLPIIYNKSSTALWLTCMDSEEVPLSLVHRERAVFTPCTVKSLDGLIHILHKARPDGFWFTIWCSPLVCLFCFTCWCVLVWMTRLCVILKIMQIFSMYIISFYTIPAKRQLKQNSQVPIWLLQKWLLESTIQG